VEKTDKIEMNLSIKCPYCNSDFVYYIYPYKFNFDGSGYDIEEVEGYFEEDVEDYDFFILGKCNDCSKTFKLKISPENPEEFIHPNKKAQVFYDKKKLVKFDLNISYSFDFNHLGYPVALNVYGKKVPFKIIKYNNAIIVDDIGTEHILYGKPPFGFYEIEIIDILHKTTKFVDIGTNTYIPNSIDNPKILVEIRRGLEWNRGELIRSTNQMFCSITKSDGFFQDIIKELERDYEISDDYEEINHVLPLEHILAACYHICFRTETLIRNKIWLILETKYYKKNKLWWKGILKSDLQSKILERAKRSGDKFLKELGPKHYLTFDECVDIIDDKWDKDFKEHFELKNQLIMNLKELALIRNDIMHFRVKDFTRYDELVLLSDKIVTIFK